MVRIKLPGIKISREIIEDHRVEGKGFVQVKGSLLGSLKEKENGGGLILRLVNHDNTENDFEVRTSWPITKVNETDLFENDLENSVRKLTVREGTIKGKIKANEIVTLKVLMLR